MNVAVEIDGESYRSTLDALIEDFPTPETEQMRRVLETGLPYVLRLADGPVMTVYPRR